MPATSPPSADLPRPRSGRPLARGAPSPAVAAALLGLASALLYLINVGHAPHPDELYHVLAARGLLEHGEPRIAEGLYERTLAYTALVAGSIRLFGDTLLAARLPSVLAMAATVALLLLWTRRVADARAGWIAAGLFALSPFAIEIAQFTRFYALQTLAFLAGATLLYRAFADLARPALVPLAAGLVCFAAAAYLQTTTLIGGVGIALWLALRSAPGIAHALAGGGPARGLALASAALAVGLAGLWLAWTTGVAGALWTEYRSVPLFNASRANDFWYYHLIYTAYYPSLWPAIGLLTLAAASRFPGPAFFCATVFATGFLLNSFAAPKSARYIVYAQPFLFALLGMGLAAVIGPLAAGLRRAAGSAAAATGLPARASRALAAALVVGSLGVLAVGNAFLLRSAMLLGDVATPFGPGPIDWAAAAPELEPLIERADVVLAQSELEMLYYYGDYDVLLSASRLGENEGAVDFDDDFRTGRPVIGSAEGLARLLDCRPNGLLVTSVERWENPDLIDAASVELVLERTTPVELDPGTGVLAFRWSEAGDAGAADCAGLPELG